MYAKINDDGTLTLSDARFVRSGGMITVNATKEKMRELGYKPYFEDEPPEEFTIYDPIFSRYVETEDEIRLIYERVEK